MLKAIIVEDEWHSQEALKNLIGEFCEGITVVGIADSVESGVAIIQKNNPDLLFLDIEMKNGTGFDLLEQLNSVAFEVIFTTAYSEYALKAIKANALDYLLKPIDIDELKSAIEKVKSRLDNQNKEAQLMNVLHSVNQKITHQKITISTVEGYEFIKVTDIVYCEAHGAYTYIVLAENRKLLVSKNLKEYENMLLEFGFYRSHNSYLINLHHVDKYIKTGGAYLVMSNGDEVSISIKKKEPLLQLLFSQQ